ncbi:MAG: hypothetical protein H0X26_08735 [Alphaproteobacteria bacterium]|nr:hypothetical protein [Alphaproteobacteria bacterium]
MNLFGSLFAQIILLCLSFSFSQLGHARYTGEKEWLEYVSVPGFLVEVMEKHHVEEMENYDLKRKPKKKQEALAASLPENEKKIVDTIFTEAESKENWDKKNETLIKDFLYQKAKDFAEHNKAFAAQFDEDFVLEDPRTDSVHLIHLDVDNVLVVFTTSSGCYNMGGLLFIVNRHKNQWAPVQLEEFIDKKIEKTYSIMTSNLHYDAPILSNNGRRSGRWAGFGVRENYLFKDGTFKLVRSVETSLDKKKAEGIDLNNENNHYEDYMKEEVRYIDSKGEWHVYDPSDERAIVNTIFAESKKNRDQRNTTELEPVADFLYQKAKDFAASDFPFTLESEIHSVNIKDLIRLDDDNVLVVVQPDRPVEDHYQKAETYGFLFIVNRHKNQWALVELTESLGRANEFEPYYKR